MTLAAKVAMAVGIATFAPALIAAPGVPTCDVMLGYSQEGKARLYEGDALFEYMDGNSEGYFLYSFVRMNGVTCVKGDRKVLIDISEMKDDESAYGMFSANRDVNSPSEHIGAGGQVVPRKAIFAKGKYFIEIAAQMEGDYSQLLRSTAVAFDSQVPGSASVPQPINWFPTDGLTSGPPRLIAESVLGIRALHRGYVAQYGSAKAFIVAEDSDSSAKQVLDKLQTRFAPVQAAQSLGDAFQADDKYLGRICIARSGRYLVGYAAVPVGADPVALVRALMGRLPK